MTTHYPSSDCRTLSPSIEFEIDQDKGISDEDEQRTERSLYRISCFLNREAVQNIQPHLLPEIGVNFFHSSYMNVSNLFCEMEHIRGQMTKTIKYTCP